MSGITNPSNATCFAISAYQFLAACDQICDIFREHLASDRSSAKCSTCNLAYVIAEIRSSRRDPVPFSLTHTLMENLRYDIAERADSREFLSAIVLEVFPTLKFLFEFRTVTTRTCNTCEAAHERRDKVDWMVNMPTKHNTVQSAIDATTFPEISTDYRCSDCNSRDIVYSREYMQMPKVLLLHNTGASALQVNEFIKVGATNYRLLGFVRCIGETDDDRHYTTFRFQGANFLEFDDSRVKNAKMDKRKRKVYLLMYNKMDGELQQNAQDLSTNDKPDNATSKTDDKSKGAPPPKGKPKKRILRSKPHQFYGQDYTSSTASDKGKEPQKRPAPPSSREPKKAKGGTKASRATSSDAPTKSTPVADDYDLDTEEYDLEQYSDLFDRRTEKNRKSTKSHKSRKSANKKANAKPKAASKEPASTDLSQSSKNRLKNMKDLSINLYKDELNIATRESVRHMGKKIVVSKQKTILPQKATKRKYQFKNWKTFGLKKERVHASMIKNTRHSVLPPDQPTEMDGYCVLCGTPEKSAKVFWTRSTPRLIAHYVSVHYKRTIILDEYTHLLCKCDDVEARGGVNRNAHHHCPVCWQPCVTTDDMTTHLVSQHGYLASKVIEEKQ